MNQLGVKHQIEKDTKHKKVSRVAQLKAVDIKETDFPKYISQEYFRIKFLFKVMKF